MTVENEEGSNATRGCLLYLFAAEDARLAHAKGRAGPASSSCYLTEGGSP